MPTDTPANSGPVTNALLGLGTWIGRRQAFGLMASKCSAADADCLKHLRESEQYKELATTWEAFCPRFLGISRVQADRLISQLAEFGATYFELSQLIRISPQTFRELGHAVTGDGIRHNGETIRICPENTRRLAAAVSGIRHNIAASPYQNLRNVDRMRQLLAAAADLASALHDQPLPDAQRATLAVCLQQGIDTLAALEKQIRERLPQEVLECLQKG